MMNRDDLRAKLDELPADRVSELADGLDITVEEFKERYLAVVARGKNLGPTEFQLQGEASEDAECTTQEFSVGIPDLMEMVGTLRYCPGACWTATATFNLYLLGVNTDSGGYSLTITCDSARACVPINVGVAKADVCLEVDSNACIYISGSACYWDLWASLGGAWVCTSFRETILCF